MPHSGGGGSHGGGSHGGSHSHGGGGSGSSRRAGSSNFAGAKRYVYYTGNRPTYIYANYDITKKPNPLWFDLIWLIPFFFIPLCFLFSSVHIPKKLSTDYVTGYYIDDRAGIVQDASGILDRMDVFYEETGITPVFVTLNNEDWVPHYVDLETYAYEMYINAFLDEKHMLIVYSQPEKPDPDFNDWYWELMQGDDTDNILTKKVDNRFTQTFQKNLTLERVSLEDALVAAFDEITPGITKGINWEFNPNFILVAIIWYGAMGYGVVKIFIEHFGKKQKLYRSATLCPEMVTEDTCEYCGGVYVVGTCLSCPHCGAPLKPHSYPKEQAAQGGNV